MCECYNAKCVFYWYDELTEEDYKVDKETLLNYVEKVIDRRKATTYRRQGFNRGGVDVDLFMSGYEQCDDDFDSVIDMDSLLKEYDKKIDEVVEKQKEQIKKFEWGTTIILEVFIAYDGQRIGISLSEEDDLFSELKSTEELVEELDEEIENRINDLYDEYSRKQDEIYERHIEERKTRYKEAVEQIKLTIQTGDRLMLCTNGKLRRAYARELAKDYSKKYDCTILIGDIEVLVEEEYRRRK